MNDDTTGFARFAQPVRFPAAASQLTDFSTCPACFTPIRHVRCAACGLDLAHESAVALGEASRRAAAALDERVELIGRIRRATALAEQEAREAARAPVATSASGAAASTVRAGAASSPPAAPPVAADPFAAAPAGASAPPPSDPSDAPPTSTLGASASGDASGPRRSGVQVLLLVVGISLLSVAAIFFAVLALVTFDLLGRSLTIAGITTATIAAASVLRARGLTATAEGIAVFGVVLVLLDVWAVRANDLLGAADSDPVAYWGVAVLLTAVAFAGWHRVSKLRAPNVVAFGLLAPGVLLIASHLATALEPPYPFAVGAIAATAVGALGRLPRLLARDDARGGSRPELLIVVGSATLAAFLAFFAATSGALAATDTVAAGALLAVLALVSGVIAASQTAGAHIAAVRVLARVLAAIAGVSAALAGAVASFQSDSPWLREAGYLVPAAAVALAGAVWLSRANAKPAEILTGVIAAGAVAAVLTVPATAIALTQPLRLAVDASRLDDASPFAIVSEPSSAAVHSVMSLAIVLAFAFIAWRVAWRGRRTLIALVATGLALAVAATTLLATVAAVAGSLIALSVVATAVLLLTPVRERREWLVVLGLAATASGLLGFGVGFVAGGWDAPTTWPWASAGALLVLALARMVGGRFDRSGPTDRLRASFSTAAIVLVLLAAARAVATVALPGWAGEPTTFASALAVSVTAAIVAIAAGAGRETSDGTSPRAWSRSDRRAAFWSAIPVALIATVYASVQFGLRPVPLAALPFPATVAGLSAAVLLLAALTIWIGSAANRSLRPERITASVLLGATVALAFDWLARALGIDDVVAHTAPIFAATVVVAAALVLTVLRRTTLPRGAAEIGAALVAVPALIVALVQPSGWLTLVVAGVATVLAATSRDGLFASRSLRRHLIWVALALATAGLWLRLDRIAIDALEAYLLPLAAALVAIAVLTARAAAAGRTRGNAAHVILFAGLAVALVPLAVDALSRDGWRAAIVFAVSAGLAIAGSLVPVSGSLRPHADAVVAAGALAVAAGGFGRAWWLATTGSWSRAELDVWAVATVAVISVVIALQSRVPALSTARRRIATGAAVAAIVGVVVVMTPALDDPVLGPVRSISIVLALALLHVAAAWSRRAPLDWIVAWTAIGAASAVAVVGVAARALEPLEWGTLPIALGLAAAGGVQLSRAPSARSWPWLGPATAVLLVPSLLATIEDRPLWRLVAIGVAGVAIVVGSLLARLQAPLLIASVVTVVHAIATLSPQIAAVYRSVDWWVWLGVGGILIIVLAARLEKQVATMKNVVRRISALR